MSMTEQKHNTPDDAQARQKAVDHTRSFIVTAPAGSGKTETLIQRILNVLAYDEKLTEPEQLVAITFTKKAAAELRVRLLGELEKAQGSEPQDEHKKVTYKAAKAVLTKDRKLGWKLLGMPARLRLCTIDSFCNETVKRFALDACNGTAPTVVDPALEAPELYREAAMRVITMAEDKTASDKVIRVRRFLRLFRGHLTEAADALISMIQTREQWGPAVAKINGSEDVENFVTQNTKRIKTVARKIVENEKQNVLNNFSAILQIYKEENCLSELLDLGNKAVYTDNKFSIAASILQNLTEEHLANRDIQPEIMQAWRSFLLTDGNDYRKQISDNCGFPKDPAFKANKLKRTEFAARCAACKKCILLLTAEPLVKPEIVQGLIHIPEDNHEAQSLVCIVGVLPLLLQALNELFRERGVADFTAVADLAVKALNTIAAHNRDNGIRHLLVDEFQDSSARQYTLVKAITNRWTQGDGRTLFVVGDKMQSIYRFRQAEVSLFIEAEKRQTIGEIPLEPLTLSKNFRSAANLVNTFNTAFTHVFLQGDQAILGTVGYTQAQAHHPQKETAHFKAYLGKSVDEVDTMVQLVREFLAKDLVFDKLSESGIPQYKQCAILVRSRGNLSNVLVRLRNAGISYQAVEIDLLNQRQSILDLQSLTRALVMPNDRFSWLALLRAPWCGATLVELEKYVPTGEEYATLPTVPHKLAFAAKNGTMEPHIQRVWEILKKTMLTVNHTPNFALMLEQTWLTLGGPACVTEKADLDAARLYFEVIADLTQGGTVASTSDLASRVNSLFAPPMANEQAARIQVMTIHKSKGLQFHTVIIPKVADARGANSSSRPLEWTQVEIDDKIQTIYVCTKSLPGIFVEENPLQGFVKSLEKGKETAEKRRLLYVGTTRACENLYLVGKLPTSGTPNSNSFAGFLWKAPEFQDIVNRTMEETPEIEAAEESQTDAEPPPVMIRRLTEMPELPASIAVAANLAMSQPCAADEDDTADEDGSAADRRGYDHPAMAADTETPRMAGSDKDDDLSTGAKLPNWLGKMNASTAGMASGTVIHAWLERLAKGWKAPEDMETKRQMIKAELRVAGLLDESKMTEQANKVIRGVDYTLRDHAEMLAKHDYDGYELPLTVVETDEKTTWYKDYIIDRLWREADGTWNIVDYKTTELDEKHRNEDTLKKKIISAEYDKQLINYGHLVEKHFGAKPERITRRLYFPMMNAIAHIGETEGDVKVAFGTVTDSK